MILYANTLTCYIQKYRILPASIKELSIEGNKVLPYLSITGK